jgi:hypothetical protein
MANLDPSAYDELMAGGFEFGLQRILDGVETFIAKRTASPDPTDEVPSG